MDNQAASKSVDSLINYETIKYFGNERVEVDKYYKYMKKYSEAALKTNVTN